MKKINKLRCKLELRQLNFLNKEQYMFDTSINLLKEFEPIALNRNSNGYVVGYSGGSDSDVLIDIYLKSKVKFMAIHNHTTLDAPQTVYYIRRKFYDLECKGIKCKIYYPKRTFIQICKGKLMLPSRIMRFCCSELKKYEIAELKGSVYSFGVRKVESVSRAKNRDSIETRNKQDIKTTQLFHFDKTEEVKQTSFCYTNKYFIVNPIAYWTNEIKNNYICDNKIELISLYKCGFNRVGCIGCPMAGEHRKVEFEMFPKYKNIYLRICNFIIKTRNELKLANKYNFKTGLEYFEHWLYETNLQTENENGQISMFDNKEA